MKVGNLVNGLAVVDVKRVNKLNLIQFLKEVDSYLQQGYQIDVTSGRQVGLVLQTDMFKTEQPFGGVDSVGGVDPVEPEPELETEKVEETLAEVTEQPKENVAVEPVEEVVKKPSPRAKKTT